ncbi:LOW QUALITY PROTEIN: hypothetical protein T265_14179, partial [Opisthorchis viverrini]
MSERNVRLGRAALWGCLSFNGVPRIFFTVLQPSYYIPAGALSEKLLLSFTLILDLLSWEALKFIEYLANVALLLSVSIQIRNTPNNLSDVTMRFELRLSPSNAIIRLGERATKTGYGVRTKLLSDFVSPSCCIRGLRRPGRWHDFFFQDGDRVILAVPGWRHYKLWLPTDVSGVLVVSFCPDCLSEFLEVLSNKSWLYGSEALVLSTDVMLSLMMMMLRSVHSLNNSRSTKTHIDNNRPAVTLSVPSFHATQSKGARWPKWLDREFTDRKVRGSNPTSASQLPLSRLGQPGSIPALVLPSGGMAARHRKGATAERFKGSTRAEILPGCSSLDRRSREAEVGFYPRAFRSVKAVRRFPQTTRMSISMEAAMLPSPEEGRVRKGRPQKPHTPIAQRLTVTAGALSNTVEILLKPKSPVLLKRHLLCAAASGMRQVEESQRRSNNYLAAKCESDYQQTQLRWSLPSSWMGTPRRATSMATDIIRHGPVAPSMALPTVPIPKKTSVNETAAATTTVRRVRVSTKKIKIKRSAVAPSRCLAAMPPEGSTRAGILPGCPSLDRGSRVAEFGFEPRTFRNISAGPEHNPVRRAVRRQVKVSLGSDREVWWTQKAKEMEEAQKAGNARRLFQLIRATDPRKPP